MTTSVENFAFESGLAALEKYGLDSEFTSSKERSEFIGDFFTDLPEFMRLYFSTDFLDDAAAFKRLHAPPRKNLRRPISDMWKKQFNPPFVEKFMSEEMREGLFEQGAMRPSDHYPLTQQELINAKSFIGKNPQLADAIAAFQSCLSAYAKTLTDKIYDHAGLHDPHERKKYLIRNELKSIDNEVNGFSFLHDLLPVMAATMAETADPFSEKSLGKALCDAFRKQSFQSQSLLNDDHRVCPFKGHIAGILSHKLQKQDDGSLAVIANQRPGVLLLSVIDRMQELKAPALHDVGYVCRV